MKQKWYGGDWGLQARMFVTIALLALVYLGFRGGLKMFMVHHHIPQGV